MAGIKSKCTTISEEDAAQIIYQEAVQILTQQAAQLLLFLLLLFHSCC
jgi:hypothetical protein